MPRPGRALARCLCMALVVFVACNEASVDPAASRARHAAYAHAVAEAAATFRAAYPRQVDISLPPRAR